MIKLLLIPIYIWAVSIFHRLCGLSLWEWYGFALFVSYIALAGLIFFLVIGGAVEGKRSK